MPGELLSMLLEGSIVALMVIGALVAIIWYSAGLIDYIYPRFIAYLKRAAE